jgi:hypothetical protein
MVSVEKEYVSTIEMYSKMLAGEIKELHDKK